MTNDADRMSNPDRDLHVFSLMSADETSAISSPLGLGMILSAVRSLTGATIRPWLQLHPIRLRSEEVLADVAAVDSPRKIVLLSDFAWTIQGNLQTSARVKQISPGTITVHGGPSAPGFEEDAATFLAAHPEVDVLVRGEGERTAVDLFEVLASTPPGQPLSDARLDDVAGIAFRRGASIIRTSDRERSRDLNDIPSPYLTGLFDHLVGRLTRWTIESVRGCPYGCTFCDWGGTTMSRLRKFDAERIRAELAWLARHGCDTLVFADANFGILERDLDVARWVVENRQEVGRPKAVSVSFAKNTTKRTGPIVAMWAEASLIAEGSISLQTVDTEVLDIVKRRNIRTDGYAALAEEFASARTPIRVEYMLGLPGSSMSTVAGDLQSAIAMDQSPLVYPTILFPNSPMNEPSERALHALQTDEDGVIVASSTFSRQTYDDMLWLGDIVHSADVFGVLRHVLRVVSHESDLSEVEVLRTFCTEVAASRSTHPTMVWLLTAFRRHRILPFGADAFLTEVRALAETCFPKVSQTSAFDVALQVQRAVLPGAMARPAEVWIEHDYVAYSRARTSDREHAPRLGTYGPSTFVVEDRHNLSTASYWSENDLPEVHGDERRPLREHSWQERAPWELDYALARVERAVTPP